MNTGWTCKACTWSNDDATTSCVMCQTLRPRSKFASAAGGARTLAASSSVEASKPAAVAAALESYVASENHNERRTSDCTRDSEKVEREKNASATSKSQWDAFATLQSNYESSSDDESGDDDSGTHRTNEESGFDESARDSQSVPGSGRRWDAFESLQSNYQSSDQWATASEQEKDDDRISPSVSSFKKSNRIECIDLVDSDDDNTNGKLHTNAKRCGKRRLDLVDSEEEQSTHNSHPVLRGKKRIKRHSNDTITKRKSPITLFDDSSISEQENGRPPPSTVTRTSRSSGILPPWQRSIPLQRNQILSGNKTLPSSSFSCMNHRNDVSGGSGAGVNGFHLSRTDDDIDSASKRRPKEAAGAKKKTKSVSSGAEDVEKTKKARPKGKRRYRRRGRSGTTSRAPIKRAAQRRSTNDPWSAHERGIRQRNNHSRGSTTSTYMMIGKQESALRSIGGASVTF